MRRHLLAAVIATLFFVAAPGISESTAEEATRMDDEVAKVALEQKHPEPARPVEDSTAASGAKGYWVDAATGLMWTVNDNGSPIDGDRAIRWCRDLVLAGFDDWRQPSIDELQGVYEASMPSGPPQIKAPIQLSDGGYWVWSGTPGTGELGPSAWLLDFSQGSRYPYLLDLDYDLPRALCVRQAEPQR